MDHGGGDGVELSAWWQFVERTAPLRRPLYRMWPNLWKVHRDLRLEWQLRRWVKEDRPRLEAARQREAAAYGKAGEPLVTVCISTYNRSKLLVERCVPSVLAQSYRNLEVLVVGDHCTDDTAARMLQIGDPRVRWVNLPEPSKLPKNRVYRHRVAGSHPKNKALELAQGTWVAHLDDDDEYLPEHVESLLGCAREGDYEFVFGKQWGETAPGVWKEIGREGFALGRRPFNQCSVPQRTVMYRSYLRFLPFGVDIWRYGYCNDKILWERMARAGVRAGFLDRVVARKYLAPR
jgi:glycosyltransferase involved in cell wall biosynthesis